jgi:hypothetical protein
VAVEPEKIGLEFRVGVGWDVGDPHHISAEYMSDLESPGRLIEATIGEAFPVPPIVRVDRDSISFKGENLTLFPVVYRVVEAADVDPDLPVENILQPSIKPGYC